MTTTSISTPVRQARLARLRALLPEVGADALLIEQPDNRKYISGFTGSNGWVLVSQDAALLATDFRYYEQVGLECPGFELVKIPGIFTETLPGMLAQAGIERLAFESDYSSYDSVLTNMSAAREVDWISTKGMVQQLRAVKDEEEVALLRAAIDLADEALGAAVAQMRPGMTERDLAWVIESYMRTHGAETVSFDTIVAGGPNGARPHARASEAPLVAGEPIVIDMGARLNGYCSDLTRTFCLGQPNDPDRFWEVYNTVLQAQQAAEAAARPGMTGQEVDAVARQVIAEAGYGDYFGHGLGHGVGLAVHEAPRFSQTYSGKIVSGNTVTVEPGIYLPGWGGVRIEDIVLVTENGVEVLTKAPKDPIVSIA